MEVSAIGARRLNQVSMRSTYVPGARSWRVPHPARN